MLGIPRARDSKHNSSVIDGVDVQRIVATGLCYSDNSAFSICNAEAAQSKFLIVKSAKKTEKHK
jgi:hypothetical protein